MKLKTRIIKQVQLFEKLYSIINISNYIKQFSISQKFTIVNQFKFICITFVRLRTIIISKNNIF